MRLHRFTFLNAWVRDGNAMRPPAGILAHAAVTVRHTHSVPTHSRTLHACCELAREGSGQRSIAGNRCTAISARALTAAGILSSRI